MTETNVDDLGPLYSKPVNATANRRRLQWSTALFLIPTLVYPLVGGLMEGRATTEKILTHWFMPIGVVWLTLLALLLFLWNQRLVWATRLAAICFLLLTFLSNGFVAGWLMSSLEAQHPTWRLDTGEPLDILVVLGGETSSSPAYGRIEAGDRVLYAAEVFHQGKAKRLIATGKSSDPSKPDPSTETKEIWKRLGIPASAIQTIGGPNTYSELIELKRSLGPSQSQRIGILSSAFHIPRVMRLAKAADLEVTPLAADHLYDPYAPIRFQSFAPSDDALVKSRLALKELLAAWVGR